MQTIFGEWTPEAVGDIWQDQIILPTSGNSRFNGSLGVETFIEHLNNKFNEESLKLIV